MITEREKNIVVALILVNQFIGFDLQRVRQLQVSLVLYGWKLKPLSGSGLDLDYNALIYSYMLLKLRYRLMILI